MTGLWHPTIPTGIILWYFNYWFFHQCLKKSEYSETNLNFFLNLSCQSDEKKKPHKKAAGGTKNFSGPHRTVPYRTIHTRTCMVSRKFKLKTQQWYVRTFTIPVVLVSYERSVIVIKVPYRYGNYLGNFIFSIFDYAQYVHTYVRYQVQY